MPLGQKDEMSQNTCDMEHNHLNTITPRLGIPDKAIPDHIQEIIRLGGGNEYKEGVQGFKRSWAGRRVKGKLSTLQFIDRKKPQASDSQDNSDDELLDDDLDDAEDEEDEESEEE